MPGVFVSCFKAVDPIAGKQAFPAEVLNLQELQVAGVQRPLGAGVKTCQLVTTCYAGDTGVHYSEDCHPLMTL